MPTARSIRWSNSADRSGAAEGLGLGAGVDGAEDPCVSDAVHDAATTQEIRSASNRRIGIFYPATSD